APPPPLRPAAAPPGHRARARAHRARGAGPHAPGRGGAARAGRAGGGRRGRALRRAGGRAVRLRGLPRPLPELPAELRAVGLVTESPFSRRAVVWLAVISTVSFATWLVVG